MNNNDKIDALLFETAQKKSAEVDFDALLKSVRQNAAASYDKPHPSAQLVKKRFRLRRLAVCAAAIFVLAAVTLMASALTKRVVINGKEYLVVKNEVNVGGVSKNLNACAADGRLLRLETTNQYVALDMIAYSKAPDIFVYPIGDCPEDIKNPNALTAPSDEPISIEPAVVYPIVGDLVVREGPGVSYDELAVLHSGQCVTMVGISGKWAIVEWGEGIAYAFSAYLFELPEASPSDAKKVMRATEPVNVRALPTSRDNSSVLHELQTGEAVVCTGEIGEWTQILWNDEKAYVFTKYLTEDG